MCKRIVKHMATKTVSKIVYVFSIGTSLSKISKIKAFKKLTHVLDVTQKKFKQKKRKKWVQS